MARPYAAAVALGRAQHGVVTTAQLHDLDVPPSTITGWVADGRLRRLDSRAYLLPAAVADHLTRVHAWSLVHGGPASHLSGGVLHGCDSVPRVHPEVLVPYGANAVAQAGVHRSRRFDEVPVVVIDGIPTVDVGPLALQLVGMVPTRLARWRCVDAIEHLVRAAPDRLDQLHEWAERGSRSRARGVGLLRRVLATAAADDCESALERRYLDLLVRHGLPIPDRQHQVVLPSGRIVRLDFAYPSIRYATELDSRRFHLTEQAFEDDRAKRNELRTEGWLLHEVTHMALETRPEAVVAQTWAVLHQRGHPSVVLRE